VGIFVYNIMAKIGLPPNTTTTGQSFLMKIKSTHGKKPDEKFL
jgi:hypothetical protein